MNTIVWKLRLGGQACGSIAVLLLFALSSASAASGTWTETTGDGTWSNSANWSGGVIADGANNTGNLSLVNLDAVAVNVQFPGFFRNAIQLDTPRTIGNLTFGDSNVSSPGGWQVYTADPINNILTLAGTTPTITVNPLGPFDTVPLGGTEVIDDVWFSNVGLAGTSGFTKLGSGVLTLAGANPNLTGTINVNEGTLRLRVGATFDFETAVNAAVTRLTIANGATLETQVSIGQNGVLPAAAGVTVPAGASATIRNIATNSQFFANVTGGAGSTLNYIATTGALTGSIDRDWAGFANINFTGAAATQSQVRLRPNGGTFNGNSFLSTAVKLDNMLMFTQTNSNGNTLMFGSLSGNSTSTLQGGAGLGTIVAYQIGSLNTNTVFAGNITTGNGLNLYKVGSGKLTLSGTLSYSTTNNGSDILRGGVTRVATGTLALTGGAAIPGGISDAALGDLYTTIDVRAGAAFDVSGTDTSYSTAPIQQVVGSGTVIGNYLHDEGRIRPGDVPVGNGNTLTPTAGTMIFANNVSFAGNGEIVYDMGLNPLAGNDRIQVNGVTDLSGSTTKVTPNFLGGTVPTSGTYTILNSTNGFTGTPSGWTVPWPGRGAGPTVVVNGTLLQFNAVPVVGGANLNWTGTTSAIWDVNTTANWRNNGTNSADTYFNDDNVTFADTHSGGTAVTNFAVTLATNVAPRSVTVDSTNNYTLTGAGVITGPSTFTKRGSSTLIMQKANTFFGVAAVEGGVVDIGSFNGALGTGNLTMSNAKVVAANTATAGMNNSGLTLAAGTTNTIQVDGAAGQTFEVPATSGNGNLVLTTTVQDKLIGIGNMSAFTGNLSVHPDGVTSTAMSIHVSPASSLPNSVVTLTNGASLANRTGASTSGTISLGALVGDVTSVLDGFTGGSTLPSTIWQIGNLGISTEFAGTIIDGIGGPSGAPVLIPSQVTKVGIGTLTLSGPNVYTGNTMVGGGVLSITNPFLADAADVFLTTGATLNLAFANTDVVDSLFIDGVSQAAGTWGSPSSTAAHKSNLFSGSGLLQVSTSVAPPLLVGDYNRNGVVDAADYAVWRNNLGTAAVLNNRDPLNMGNVSQADYTSWKTNFGTTLAGAGSLGAQSSVPEPPALTLTFLVILSLAGDTSRAARLKASCRRRFAFGPN